MTGTSKVLFVAEKVGWKVHEHDKGQIDLYTGNRTLPVDDVDTHQLLMLAVLEKEGWGIRQTVFLPPNDRWYATSGTQNECVTEMVLFADLALAVIEAAYERWKVLADNGILVCGCHGECGGHDGVKPEKKPS